MTSVYPNPLNFNKYSKINFDGGNLSSDSGLLAYRSFDEKIGFSKLIRDSFNDDDIDESNLTYVRSDVVLQNIYKSVAGYHTADNSDELTDDPIFKEILMCSNVASQPTVSRRNNELDKSTFKTMESINTELLDRAYKVDKPKFIVFDIDSTDSIAYGNQKGSAYNSHYATNGFHPLLLFDGMTGDLIKAELRSGNVYTSRNVTKFMGPVLKQYLKHYKSTFLVIRADSGFAVPEFYKIAEEHHVAYCIRLKANKSLGKLAKELTLDFYDLYGSDYSKNHVLYGEFYYRANSWNVERRVVCKIQRKAGELLPTHTFVVTTMTSSPKDVIKFYSNRGTMENFIKEAKLDFSMTRFSHTSYMANANKLMQSVLAYNLNNLMRRLCLSKTDKSKRMHTLRTVLVKVASRVVSSGGYKTFKLCSSYPYKKFLVNLLKNIELLPSFG